METRHPSPYGVAPASSNLPDADALAALRAWYAGLSTRHAVRRYLPDTSCGSTSARGTIGRIRRELVALARRLHRDDLVTLLSHRADERLERS